MNRVEKPRKAATAHTLQTTVQSCAFRQPREIAMSIATILPRQLDELRATGKTVDLIDVRTPPEYRAMHVPYACNVPLDRLDARTILQSRQAGAEEPLYVICHSGSRGQKACEQLRAAGIGTVVNVEGGTLAWAASGLPVIRGKASMSLDRQVRIAIGLIVLAGVILGWLVHPVLAGLAAFAGAGLVFAGIFDICPLAMAIAHMPWNRGDDATATCQTSIAAH
jgi:rhodanese-related sulfurtransferase